MKKTQYTLMIAALLSVLAYQGCILEDFDTIPINIPVALPVVLADDGSHNFIISDAAFCLDSSEIYEDYKGKIKKITLVEVAFRFTDVTPADVSGNMRFILRKVDVSGDILLDHVVTVFNPAQYKVPNTPFVLDLSADQLELMNLFLSQNEPCFYGNVEINNLTPAGAQKVLLGYVDMLFKAETEF